MRKRMCAILAFFSLLFFAGCTQAEPLDTSASNTSDTSINNTQETETVNVPVISKSPLAAVSVPTTTESLIADNGTVIFEYTYQNMSLTLQDPDVADKIIIDFLNRIDKTRELAQTTADSAKYAYDGSENWIPFLYHVVYSPTRIDQGVLSLFGTNAVYSGMFHPDRSCVSVSYDLTTGDVLTLASIMSTKASVNDFCKLVLEGLSEMSEGDYLYENYAETVKDRFSVDPSQDEALFFTQTGLSFYFAPYEIAPYSSGIITVEIPYEKLTGLLNDAYFPAERETPHGSITVQPFENTDPTQFSQISEVITDKDGDMYLVHTEGMIQDIRILINDEKNSYTVFAAYELSAGDGIMIQISEEKIGNVSVCYKSEDERIVTPLIP